jgi:solute carrier family 35 protein F5
MLSRAYALGLFFIVLVAIMWAASSIMVQYLYSDHSFQSPFLVTYIGVSLFTLWLPAEQLTKWVRKFGPWCSSTDCDDDDDDVADAAASETESITASYHNNSSVHSVDREEEDLHPSDISAEQIGLAEAKLPWTDEQHFHAACCIAPVWFLANWTYAASLLYTSITSSTVLASTGSLFTFLFAVLTKDENFGSIKLLGVILGVCGSCLTTLQDTHSSPASSSLNSTGGIDDAQSSLNNPLLGDLLGLMSAIGYGAYAVQTRLLCPHDESLYSMQRLLGYIGLLNLVVLSPIAFWLLLGRVELSAVVFWFLVVKGLFDNVLSDYLWLRAVILINATVATVGLGLTIPLAFASDVMLGKTDVLTPGTILGALTVLAGFVLVNVGNDEDYHPPAEESATPPLHPVEDSEDDGEREGMSLQSTRRIDD